mmetsp:Transcript_12737/g.18138  ORF Transcript_12737/g.18138 Transcript_12737/m.18138 type:complete len:89 (-) Transcript_12737:116-382(-)
MQNRVRRPTSTSVLTSSLSTIPRECRQITSILSLPTRLYTQTGTEIESYSASDNSQSQSQSPPTSSSSSESSSSSSSISKKEESSHQS